MILQAMGDLFDQTDFSVIVKNRAPPPKRGDGKFIELVERPQ
jgi:hypothetical protein